VPATVEVHPGGSIQAAVNAAPPGTTILIDPGTYAEAVTVSKNGLSLIGLHGPGGAGVVIANPGGADTGILVTSVTGFTLRNVTVTGFGQNGVSLVHVDHFVVAHVALANDGQYGVFPLFSAHGLIEHSTATGQADTGFYVGQSHDVLLTNDVASHNVNGFEVENSVRVSVIGNASHDNVAGILVDLLPGLAVKVASDNLLVGNVVYNNNAPNTASPPDIVAAVPSGSGILIVGADRTTVEGNLVTGNNFTGIGLASTLFLGRLAHLPPAAFAGIDPNPDHNEIEDNVVVDNGARSPIPFAPGADLLWDGTGVGNCWMGNLFLTSFPSALPDCLPAPHGRRFSPTPG
jgi:parallel beta-helix repeat protein